MSNDDLNRKRYSEEEFALILKKASEMLSSSGGGSTSLTKGEGLTLEEMRSIAAEAGIDPEAVTRAAAVVGATEWEEKAGLAAAIFGGPSKFHLDCELPGRLPDEELGRILEQIRRAAQHQGEITEVLGGFEWKTVGELSAINIHVSPRGDSTSVQVAGDRSAAGAITFTFPVAGAAILVGALGATFEPTSAAGIISLITGTLGAGFLTARTLWVVGSRRFKKRLTKVMEAVSSSVERTAVLPPGGEAAKGPEGDA